VNLPVVLADADNTLWNTDSVFAEAQLILLAAVDPDVARLPREQALAHVRQFDQSIAEIDHRHLRYPPSMLVRVLELGADGLDPKTAARRVASGAVRAKLSDAAVAELVDAYLSSLQAVPPLLPGVREGLRRAKESSIPTWILTEGSAERQRERAGVLGIGDLVCGVSETIKNAEQFARQRRRFLPSDLFVIGDQPDRDIQPARSAGCFGILISSGFRPKWVEETAWRDADFVADDFATAMNWVLEHVSTPRRRAGAG